MDRGEEAGSAARRTAPIVLVALGIAAGAAAAWLVRDVLLLAFAAVLVAILFDAMAAGIRRTVPLTRTAATGVAIVLIVLLLGAAIVVFGAQMTAGVRDLADRLPDAVDAVSARLGLDVTMADVEAVGAAEVDELGTSLIGRIGSIATSTAAIAVNVVIVATGAAYFALQPGVYRGGLLHLLAPLGRARAGRTLDTLVDDLRHWMVGQLMLMVFVGMATTAALLLLGVPSAVVLGLFAGLAEFVPIVGPIAAAIPAVLIAASEDFSLSVWTALAYLVIQQVESNVVQPLIQRRMVRLPPAATVFSILVFGVLFGIPGVLLATPLTVAAFVLVREFWPGEREAGRDRRPDRTER